MTSQKGLGTTYLYTQMVWGTKPFILGKAYSPPGQLLAANRLNSGR